MNFLEAVKLMKEGKKLKVSELHNVKGHYYYLEDTRLIGQNGEEQAFDTEFLDFNWEIVEEEVNVKTGEVTEIDKTKEKSITEEKTLSDCIHDMARNNKVKQAVLASDVKKANKKFIDWLCKDTANCDENVEHKAKEIFGDKLI